MRLIRFGILASLAIASPIGAIAAQPAPAPQSAESAAIDQAFQAIGAKDPARALALADQVIAAEQTAHRGERRTIYSAGSLAESLAYAAIGAKVGKDTVVLGPEWGQALFLKGYALIDLGRPDEARKYLERAVEMSPFNAQFLGELAEWHKSRRQWSQAYELFARAEAVANLMPDEGSQKFFLSRALRGQGFVRIEQGKLDEAEALFRRCLQIDPNDAGARSELEYIAQERRKRATS